MIKQWSDNTSPQELDVVNPNARTLIVVQYYAQIKVLTHLIANKVASGGVVYHATSNLMRFASGAEIRFCVAAHMRKLAGMVFSVAYLLDAYYWSRCEHDLAYALLPTLLRR